MTQGVIRTQNTDLYFAEESSSIFKVACAAGVTGLGGAADQIDTTCLDSSEREYARGMLNPGQVTVPINFIPQSAAHQALLRVRDSGETISWMIVLSDQSGAPNSLDTDGRLVTPGATTFEFLAYIADFTFDIALNEIVRGTLTLQRSGAIVATLPSAIYA